MLLLLTLTLFSFPGKTSNPVYDDEDFVSVAKGFCKPTGCVAEWSNCQVNGYYRNDWPDDYDYESACYYACIAEPDCIGYTYKYGSDKYCYVFKNTYGPIPDGWTPQVTQYTDIFTAINENGNGNFYSCWKRGGKRRETNKETAFGHLKIDLADSQLCGHQLPGDNHYGACDSSAVDSGVLAKKICQVTSEPSIPGYDGDDCQASRVDSVWMCNERVATDPECAGNFFWITGNLFTEYLDDHVVTSCACLLNGVSLDDVELTSDVGSRVYVFRAEKENNYLEEGEPKYKKIHEGARFKDNLLTCGYGNYGYGECTGEEVKRLCNSWTDHDSGKCEDIGITDVASCSVAVVADPGCDITFVVTRPEEDEFKFCACYFNYADPYSHLYTVDESMIERQGDLASSVNMFTFYPGTRWSTYIPTTTPSSDPSATPTPSQPTEQPTLQPSPEPTHGPTAQPATSIPTMNPTTSEPTFPEPTMLPTTSQPSMIPTLAPSTSKPSEQPTEAPSRTSSRRDIPFLNAFEDVVGSDENLDEFLTSCTEQIRSIFADSTTSCVHAWPIVFDEMMISIQDYCGTNCHSLNSDEQHISTYGLNVPGFGQLYTEWSGTPNPTFAPTKTDAPSASTTPAPTVPCTTFPVNVVIAVWGGSTVDWGITEEVVTITEEGEPEPAACYADSASYYGPDEGEAPIPYEETCCLPGGEYTLTCLATFNWGDSSVSVNGKEYCRGLNEEMQTHVIYIDGPATNPDDVVDDLQDLLESSSGLLSVLFATIAVVGLF